MIQIVPVDPNDGLGLFIDFPHDLYKDDPNYVPEIYSSQLELLTNYPVYGNSAVQYFLAYVGDTVVGRIATFIKLYHSGKIGPIDGYFGFFDCIDNKVVAGYLFDAASRWLRDRNAVSIIGPLNFSCIGPLGMLVDGFQLPPSFMTPYNSHYYPNLMDRLGFKKKTEVQAYKFTNQQYGARRSKDLDRFQVQLKRKGITFRKVDMKNFKRDVLMAREVYIGSQSNSIRVMSMKGNEFDHIAERLKKILDPDLCILAEEEGKVIGFAFAIPDLNQILIKIRRGRLFPLGLLKIKLGKKKISSVRIIFPVVLDSCDRMSIEACLFGSVQAGCLDKKLSFESSWTLKDNALANNALIPITGEPHKKFRLYLKDIE